MTKVTLTKNYINKINAYRAIASVTKMLISKGISYPTLTGGIFCYVDRTNLNIIDTGVRNEDIIADWLKSDKMDSVYEVSVPIYNQKTIEDTKSRYYGKATIDLSNLHSTVSVNIYNFKNKTSQVEMPDAIATNLINSNIVEEVE